MPESSTKLERPDKCWEVIRICLSGLKIVWLGLVLLVSLNASVSASPQNRVKQVLVIASYRPTSPIASQWSQGIQSVFKPGPPPSIKVDIEYLDIARFNDDQYLDMLVDVYRYKYSRVKPDLIITVNDPSLEFILTHGAELFANIPVVFTGVEQNPAKHKFIGANATGVLSDGTYRETLDLALNLHPHTKNVTVVAGSGRAGRAYINAAQKVYKAYEDRIGFTYLTGLSMHVILEKVAALSNQTIVICLPVIVDGAGKKFVAPESLSLISKASAAPVYSCWELFLGRGIVGGYLYSFEVMGRSAAELGLRILKGEEVEGLPMVSKPEFKYMFDWRQLKRWSISEDKLPPGSLVKFKEHGTWEKYKGQILGGIALILMQTLIISLLLFQRRIRLRTEQILEERLNFEKILSELSSDFTQGFADKADSKIIDGLAQVGSYMDVDRCYLFRFNWDRTEFRNTHMWQAKGIPTDPSTQGVIIKDYFPWLASTLLDGKDVIVNDVNALSGEKTRNEYDYCKQLGIQSFVVIPVQMENTPLCAIGLDSMQIKKEWSKENRDRLRLVGEVFANAVERKHSEERLMAAESRYRTVADFTYDWEYWQNTDGTLQYVSPSCERICGYDAREFIESPTLFHDIIIPEDKKIWDGHATKTEKAQIPGEIQFRIKRKDGEIRWIEHVCQPITDPHGVQLGFRASNRDITKRKHYRSETDKLQTELAHMDRVVTISTLTSALAHEINQPLAAMRSYAQAALRFMDRDQPEYTSVRKALQGIVADNKRAADVVNRLRALVKKGQVQREAIDINALIKDVIGLVNSEFVLRDTMLSLDLDPKVPIVQGDPVQIQQVMINLLTNALDAMGGQTKKARTLIVSTRLENTNKIIVSISDSGEGIAHGSFETIFSPFHTTKSTGMGLGLSICKTIIEAHGGQIYAENNADGGALFSFSLTANDTE